MCKRLHKNDNIKKLFSTLFISEQFNGNKNTLTVIMYKYHTSVQIRAINSVIKSPNPIQNPILFFSRNQIKIPFFSKERRQYVLTGRSWADSILSMAAWVMTGCYWLAVGQVHWIPVSILTHIHFASTVRALYV